MYTRLLITLLQKTQRKRLSLLSKVLMVCALRSCLGVHTSDHEWPRVKIKILNSKLTTLREREGVDGGREQISRLVNFDGSSPNALDLIQT